MKQLKRVVPFVLAAVILNFLFYFTLTIGGYAHIYDTALGWFAEPCDIRDDDFSEYDLLEDSLHSDTLFCFEVKEGYAVTLDFMSNTAKHLSRKLGARFIVCEFGYATAGYLNRYLEGDNAALLTLFEHSSGDIRTEEFLAFLAELREDNTKLDERRQLEFVGIGIDPSELTALYIDSLYEAVATKLQSAEVKAAFTSELRSIDPDAYFAAIRDALKSDSQPYRELFADKFNAFNVALGEYFADEATNVDYMTQRLIDEYNRSVGGKFMLFVTSDRLYESIGESHAVLFDRVCLGRFIYDDDYSFGLDGEESDVYTVDDRFMSIFEGWRSVVHRIAGRELEGYRFADRENSPLIFAALDLTPTTPTSELPTYEVTPSGAEIWEDILNEDNDNN